MSSIFSISSVTDAGIAAMQEALDHGYTMTFTAMKTGNGIYTTGEDVTGRTALKSLKNTYTIGSIEEDTDGATVSAVFANYDGVNILVAEDYKINEIGLFCTVNGIEYLYALAAVPNDDGMEMPAYDIVAENLVQFIQEWYVENSNNASITVDPAGAYIPVTDIVDNLTSTSTTKPLSANQGKALNDTKQPKTLSTPITIGGTSQTTVEGALGGLNTVKAERADITSIICAGATNDTGATITEGTYFYLNNVLCKALASIADGATFTLNTNYKEVTAGEELTELNSNLSNNFNTPIELKTYDSINNQYTCVTPGRLTVYGIIRTTQYSYISVFVNDTQIIGMQSDGSTITFTNSYRVNAGDRIYVQYGYDATLNHLYFYPVN